MVSVEMPSSFSNQNYIDRADAFIINNGGISNNGLFNFRRKAERVDWRKIAAINIDQITQNMDFGALQENLHNITFCNIEAEIDVRMIDPNFVKLFKLSQLTVEYLLRSQDCLTNQIGALEEKTRKCMEDREENMKKFEQLQKEMEKLTKESHKRKKLLAAQQQLIHGIPGNFHKCPYCNKAFLSSSFLQSHISRRHPEFASQHVVVLDAGTNSGGSSSNHVLVTELKEIKERLQNTESQLEEEQRMLKQLQRKEQSKDQDAKADSVEGVQELSKNFKEEMEKQIEMLMKALKEMQEKYEASEQAVVELQTKYGRKSNLGELEDDTDEEKRLLEQQRSKRATNEKLAHEIAVLRKSLKSKLEQQEQKWNKKMENLRWQYEEDRQQLEEAQQKNKNSLIIAKKTQQEYQSKLMELNSKPAKRHLDFVQQPTRNQQADLSPVSMMSSSKMLVSSTELENMDESEEEEDGETIDEKALFEGSQETTGTFSGEWKKNRQQVKENPSVFRRMREELSGLLQNKLEKIGIPMKSKGISEKVLNNKLSIMKKEREVKLQRFPNLMQLRQQIEEETEDKAKRQLQVQCQTSLQFTHSPPPFPKTVKAKKDVQIRKDEVAKKRKHGTISVATKESLTISSPLPLSMKSGTQLQPTGQWSPDLWDDDDDWDNDDSQPVSLKESKKVAAPIPASRLIHKEQHSIMATNPSPVAKAQPKSFPRSSANDSFDSDGLEDLEESLKEITPSHTVYHHSASIKPSKRPSSTPVSFPLPQGQKVTQLTNTIEDQLQIRKKIKFAGAVDLMGTIGSQQTVKQSADDDDDDDDFDVSSLGEDNELAVEPPHPVRPPVPVPRNQQDTDFSSNTYGTSAWGSSSRAASSLNSNSLVKSSLSSIDSWEDDDNNEI